MAHSICLYLPCVVSEILAPIYEILKGVRHPQHTPIARFNITGDPKFKTGHTSLTTPPLGVVYHV